MLQLSEFVWKLRSSIKVVYNNFLLIDATDRSKISSDQKRLFFDVSLYPRDVIRRLCNKGRDQDSKGIWGLGIDRMVTYSTSDNYVLRHLSVSSVHRSGGKQSVYSFFSTISMKQCW